MTEEQMKIETENHLKDFLKATPVEERWVLMMKMMYMQGVQIQFNANQIKFNRMQRNFNIFLLLFNAAIWALLLYKGYF